MTTTRNRQVDWSLARKGEWPLVQQGPFDRKVNGYCSTRENDITRDYNAWVGANRIRNLLGCHVRADARHLEYGGKTFLLNHVQFEDVWHMVGHSLTSHSSVDPLSTVLSRKDKTWVWGKRYAGGVASTLINTDTVRNFASEIGTNIGIEGKTQTLEAGWEVAGGTFDLGKVLSGEPECWLEPSIPTQTAPLRVLAIISRHCEWSAGELGRLGLAVLAVVAGLEKSGVPVDLSVGALINYDYGSAGPTDLITVNLKRATDKLETSSIMPIVSNAMFRRVIFGNINASSPQGSLCSGKGYAMSPCTHAAYQAVAQHLAVKDTLLMNGSDYRDASIMNHVETILKTANLPCLEESADAIKAIAENLGSTDVLDAFLAVADEWVEPSPELQAQSTDTIYQAVNHCLANGLIDLGLAEVSEDMAKQAIEYALSKCGD